MKTTLLFIFAGLIAVNAQIWAPVGATWHYRQLYNNMGQAKDGTVKIEATSTVTVLNKVCTRLTSSFRGAQYNTFPGAPAQTVVVSTHTLTTYDTYAESGVIYIYNGTDFDTLVNLNAKPGDFWKTPNYGGGCDSVTPLTVTDTGHTVINGINLRQIGLTFKKKYTGTNGLMAMSYTFTERVGIMNAFLFPSVRCVSDDSGDPYFSCYADANFPVHKRAGVTECDVTTVGLVEQRVQPLLSLYPNPSNGIITVQTTVPVSIQVIDHLGRVLYNNDEVPPGVNSIDTDLTKGIYFLVATSDYQKKIIRFVRE